MKSLEDITVSRNCDGDFPNWRITEQGGGILGYVQFNTPEVCRGCDFIMQCTLRLSANLLGMPQLTPDSLEHEELIARMQKATMMMVEGDLTQEAYLSIMSEVQSKVWELDNGNNLYVN